MQEQDKKVTQMKEQINSYMRKKDYYDILGVNKTCQEADVKKAYKKLALRFHPDKNSVQGSKQVFKKVTNAYATLSDANKRAEYDRYGPQEDRQSPNHHPRYRYYTQQDELDEIFRAFFGAAAGPRHQNNNAHFQHFTFNMGGNYGQRQQHNHHQPQSQFPFFYFFLFIIAMYILPAIFGGNNAPYHSLQRSNTYQYGMKTSVLQTPYFVRQQYFKQAKNKGFKANIEQTVDSQYLVKLKKQCDNSTWIRNKFLYQAKQYSYESHRKHFMEKAAAVDMSYCRRQQQLYQKYPQHIRSLFHY